jgi:hypothetical protein
MVTDLGSTNGTWLNRGQLRPRADTHLRPNDLLSLGGPPGGSPLQLRLVAMDPAAFPSPIARATGLLSAAQRLGDARDEFVLDAESAAIAAAHQQLLAAAKRNVHNGRTWLQLANAERRLAKRHAGGRFALSRVYYAAAVAALEAEVAFGPPNAASSAAAAETSIRVVGSSGGCAHAAAAAQLAAWDGSSAAAREPLAAAPPLKLRRGPPQREAAGQPGPRLLRAPDEAPPDGDAGKDRVRALRSWARMEGWLGCARGPP